MALPFVASDAGLLLVQAATVAAPRLAPGLTRLDRFGGRGWALVPLASIVGVIFAIRYVSDTATGLTYLALVTVPLLAAAGLGWASRGARAGFALVTIPLFAVVWATPHSLAGQACGALLAALSCVTLGVLLAAVAPAGWLKLGIVAMSAADVWLVAADLLQAPNNSLVAAHPAGGLPSLQSESFGSVTLGYGDLFVAGLLGALLAADRGRQWWAALLTLLLAAVFDLLFFFINELPATVPVAVALIVVEVWAWRRRLREPAAASASRRPWRRAAVTPRRAT